MPQINLKDDRRKLIFPLPRGGHRISSSTFLCRRSFGYNLTIASYGTGPMQICIYKYPRPWVPTQFVETIHCSVIQPIPILFYKIKTQIDSSLVTISYAFYEEKKKQKLGDLEKWT